MILRDCQLWIVLVGRRERTTQNTLMFAEFEKIRDIYRSLADLSETAQEMSVAGSKGGLL